MVLLEYPIISHLVLYFLVQFLGVDPLQAGNVVQLVLVLGLTVGWISTYIFRVSNKEMTYAQQLRDYENKVMEVRFYFIQLSELEYSCCLNIMYIVFRYYQKNCLKNWKLWFLLPMCTFGMLPFLFICLNVVFPISLYYISREYGMYIKQFISPIKKKKRSPSQEFPLICHPVSSDHVSRQTKYPTLRPISNCEGKFIAVL